MEAGPIVRRLEMDFLRFSHRGCSSQEFGARGMGSFLQPLTRELVLGIEIEGGLKLLGRARPLLSIQELIAPFDVLVDNSGLGQFASLEIFNALRVQADRPVKLLESVVKVLLTFQFHPAGIDRK